MNRNPCQGLRPVACTEEASLRAAPQGSPPGHRAAGPDGVAEVHVFDLVAHGDRVIRHGHSQGSFLVAGGLVVWPESPRPPPPRP